MSTSSQKILIVGGVAGGATAAARLRRLSETAKIIVFERGPYISYANCGLPYYLGGEIAERSTLTLQTPANFKKRYNIDVRVKHEVIGINRSAKSVSVKNLDSGEVYTESYDKLILSTGAEPILPDGGIFRSEKIFTLRTIPDVERIRNFVTVNKPSRAVVIGGGYIGLEAAENLHRLGLDVSIIQRGNHVLPPLDFDMACEIHRHIESQGIRLLLETEVTDVAERGDDLRITLKNGETLDTDFAVLAIGVKPDTEIVKDTWLETNARGAIIASDAMLTSDPDIYALGDATEIVEFVSKQKGYIPLAGPANKQGRIAADQIMGRDSRFSGTQGSAIIRVFDMTVATTGLNERAVQAAKIEYVKSFTHSSSHAGYFPGGTDMTIKILCEKSTGRLLGAQIVGVDGVDKRCDVFATAIRGNMTASDLAQLELCYAPPYSSAKDPVNMAGFVMENILTGLVKVVYWHDIAKLQKDPGAILLDVRTKIEHETGSIDGFINIPLDELRSRLDELDKNKRIYATCKVGMRGYLATRILVQHGFDAFNLSGGYKLYHSIFGPKISFTRKPREKITQVESSDNNYRTETATLLTGEKTPENATAKVHKIDARGLQCPGPIMKLSTALAAIAVGEVLEIQASDAAFASDVSGFCKTTGCTLEDLSQSRGTITALIRKGASQELSSENAGSCSNGTKKAKNFIVFSGELDRAMAAFIMANAAASMGRKVSMFFTFWGLNILRKPEMAAETNANKDWMSKVFGWMMPRGSKALPLSKMNFFGWGAMMMRSRMANKNIENLESLMRKAKEQGVELVACSMSMDALGISETELIDGVKLGGAAAMLAHAEDSDMSLFI